MRRLVPILAAAALLAPAASIDTPTASSSSSCSRTYTAAHFKRAARKTMRSPLRLTAKRGRRLHRMIRCSRTARDRRAMVAKLAAWRSWRRSTRGRWTLAYEREPAAWRAWEAATAACESHGDPRAIGGGGRFRGRDQFTFSTWAHAGGQGDPIDAYWKEQATRAIRLARAEGTGHWPVCGH